jgi:hypothetical protein
MPAARTSVATVAKYPDIIYETAFFHRSIKLFEINDRISKHQLNLWMFEMNNTRVMLRVI